MSIKKSYWKMLILQKVAIEIQGSRIAIGSNVAIDNVTIWKGWNWKGYYLNTLLVLFPLTKLRLYQISFRHIFPHFSSRVFFPSQEYFFLDRTVFLLQKVIQMWVSSPWQVISFSLDNFRFDKEFYPFQLCTLYIYYSLSEYISTGVFISPIKSILF